MHISNRAAEQGGEIINDATLHTFTSGRYPVMGYAITNTVINTVTSPSGYGDREKEMVNAAYYNGKTILAGEFIYLNIATIKLDSGVFQVFF